MLSFLRRATNKPDTKLSIVVVAYDMAREIPRTLQSLQRSYQRDGNAINYEVIVVDNGSPEPLSRHMVESFGDNFSLLRIDKASPSPVAAINQAADMARGNYLGIVIDGARMLSPGVVYWASQAFALADRAIVSVLGFHLGPAHQRLSSAQGYNQAMEDELLTAIDWPHNGYRLFDIASLAGSSKFGWLAPLAESNCLMLPRTLFHELGGFEQRFQSPGGGLANLDFYKRCCEANGTTLFHLMGEGCFHQIHGGVTTGGTSSPSHYHELTAEYEAIRGEPHRIASVTPVLLGQAQTSSLWLMADSAGAHARNNRAIEARQSLFSQVGATYMSPSPASGDKV